MSEDELFRGEFVTLRAFLTREVGAEEADRLVVWAEREARARLYAPKARALNP